MGLIHMPRVVASIAKGLYRGRHKGAASFVGSAPHIYTGHVGLFDIDYLGHMNNASYLNHAEYARWEWTAETGMLKTFLEKKSEFIVTSATVRYRREMKPLFRKFEVQTSLCGVNDRTFSIYQNFRYPGVGGVNKIRAQVLITGVIRRGRDIFNPKKFLIEEGGVDSSAVEALDKSDVCMDEAFLKSSELDDLLKQSAAEDDLRVDPPPK
jgi:acyl-CoA thioesterase FadM|mmetsp:Transcript_7689/g.14047  ORF Transcript_7689/g.14047 Transcript_7689/m.14047 type:complete len:210 (-) Transcript_7689:79-708(-)